jgi:hypothetical protein
MTWRKEFARNHGVKIAAEATPGIASVARSVVVSGSVSTRRLRLP